MKQAKTVRTFLAVCTFLLGIMTTSASAAEIIMSVEKVFEKTVDNVIVLFDSSSSMTKNYGETTMTRLEAEREILNQANMTLPDLDWNIGFYSFTPKAGSNTAPFKTISPMTPYSKDSVAKAIEALPAKASGPTLLQNALVELDSILAGLKGKTAILVFTDGTYSKKENFATPLKQAKKLEQKYDICIYAVSSATGEKEEKLLKAMSELNECSLVIPFFNLLNNPGYTTGALYRVIQKIVTVDIENGIFFEFNKFDLQPQYRERVLVLAKFIDSHPKVRVTLAGYTDGVGSEGYNMELSRKRAESVATLLLENSNIDPNRITLQWYGKADPMVTNTTAEGRALNRRVSVILTASASE
ncbi:MAG: OmpA family protein [Thermodesulfobacteriota bacterium]|nr:OmpA family protein [Thermodesulfobacteriota bacterium]